ncbi:hypothetical protein D3C80_2006700 [compost metagenome]
MKSVPPFIWSMMMVVPIPTISGALSMATLPLRALSFRAFQLSGAVLMASVL